MNQTLQQRQQEHEGVKNAVLSNSPRRTPCLGLQKQDRLPQRTLPFCQPRGLLQKSSGIQSRDPTRSTAGRRISTILRFTLLLSSAGIPVFPVWLRCLPSSVFWYWFCSRARVSWVVTSEFDGKWIANSGHDKGENLNSGWLWQKNTADEESLCY